MVTLLKPPRLLAYVAVVPGRVSSLITACPRLKRAVWALRQGERVWVPPGHRGKTLREAIEMLRRAVCREGQEAETIEPTQKDIDTAAELLCPPSYCLRICFLVLQHSGRDENHADGEGSGRKSLLDYLSSSRCWYRYGHGGEGVANQPEAQR
jgi:hypothetical protein